MAETFEEFGVESGVIIGDFVIMVGGVAFEDTVVPEEGDVAGVLADFVEELLAEEVGFVLCLEVHIVGVAQGAVHDREGMERERGERVGLGVNPPHRARGLQAEACLVGERHREVGCCAGIGKNLHIVNGAAEVVAAVEDRARSTEPGTKTCYIRL